MANRERMAPADAAWLHMDRPNNLMVVNAVMWFEQPPDWTLVRKILEERVVERHPRFRQRVVDTGVAVGPFGAPHWEDDDTFDIGNHLHHLALPSPGGQQELQELIADLMATPIDAGKPLWHSYLIDGYGVGSAILMRFHHCIADGIALAEVMLSLTDDAPDADVRVHREPSPVRSRGLLARVAAPAAAASNLVGGAVAGARGAAGAVLHESREVLANPDRLRELVGAGRADVSALTRVLLLPSDSDSVLRGSTGVAKRVAWSTPIALTDVKAAGRATGGTVNDVLLTALTGSLRSYLERRGSPVDEVRALVMVNLRRPGAPLPRKLGNRFGLVFLALPVGLPDRLDRLAELRSRMEGLKHSPESAVFFGILNTIGLVPTQVGAALVDILATKGTIIVTNVPGPRQTVYLAGTPVAGVIPWVPASGDIGVGVSIFSYAGQVFFGIASDAGILSDPDSLVDEFERELAALLTPGG
jgi:diacylglycerol O-acyltransferase / wax synthase